MISVGWVGNGLGSSGVWSNPKLDLKNNFKIQITLILTKQNSTG